MTTRFSFISHAATEAQRKAAFPLDEPIRDLELTKISATHLDLSSPDQALSAPEQRAQQTSSALGISVSVVEELRDCDYGQWRGLTMETVQNKDPEGIMAWLTEPAAAPHGGESIEHLINRVGQWLERQSSIKHTLAITHPSVIRAAIVYALHLPMQTFWRFDIAPLTLTDLRLSQNIGTLRCVGCPVPTMLAGTGRKDA